MGPLDEFSEDLSLFVEAGLIAIKQGDEESAKKLFAAVHVLDPESTAPKMGYGLIALHKMDLKTAEKNFLEVIRKEGDNYRAKAFLGFAYVLHILDDKEKTEAKKDFLKKGAELASEVLKHSEETSTRNLAESILDWEKELQEKGSKTHGPMR